MLPNYTIVYYSILYYNKVREGGSERESEQERERERWMDERTEGSEAARRKAVKRPAPWGRRS